jgi:hypothetical protein
MQDIDFFEGKRSVKQVSFSLNRGKTKLDCHVWEEWQLIEPTPFTLRCNNKRELKVINRSGFEETHTNTFESNIGATIGVKGIASLESSLKTNIGEEIKFQAGKEESDSFTFSAPECGYLLVKLYQKIRTFYFKYEDTRFWHKRSLEFPLIKWSKPIYDGTIKELYDAGCNCKNKQQAVREGIPCRVVFQNFSKLAVFWEDTGQLEFPDNAQPIDPYFSKSESAWTGKLPASVLPDYLRFLTGTQQDSILEAKVWKESVFFPNTPDLYPQEIVNIELDEAFQPVENNEDYNEAIKAFKGNRDFLEGYNSMNMEEEV